MADYLEIARRVAREMMADEPEIRKPVVENSGSDSQLELMDQAKQEVEHAAFELPSCPRCASYALYRLSNGTTDCGTCGANFLTVRMIRSM
jgi:hypothetical protein